MKKKPSSPSRNIWVGKRDLSIEDLVAVAGNGAEIRLTRAAEKRIRDARALIEKWIEDGEVIYGITTGFGGLSDVRISTKNIRRLQKNILMSHAVGVGKPLDEEIVRAMILIRINDLAKGHSGIRFETVRYLVEMLNRGVCPMIPEKGSVGASGDLAPTAHLGLVLMGSGKARHQGRQMSGKQALARIGLAPLAFQAGEGLALINGTQVMTAIAALAVNDAARLSKMADIACAMSLEVLMGSDAEFDPRIYQVRPHPGQGEAADNMRRITKNSEIIHSHADCSRIQDAYTLRCSPQIHGATKDAIRYVRTVVETEINATTTNPLIFPDTGEFLLGGNFHGQPIALAADFLAMSIAELGNVSERRVERLVNPHLSELPAFLVEKGGLNSGYMIAQYTAAALVSENKVLAHPASVDSIPTSANKEDHVSMGTISARKCRDVLANTEHVIAVELLCAAQAMDLLPQSKIYAPGEGTRSAYKTIRNHIPMLKKDRILSRDIETMVAIIRKGEILHAVEMAVGKLK